MKYKLQNIDSLIATLTPEEKAYVKVKFDQYTALNELATTRKKLGISQDELSKMSGIPRPTISKIENGERNATIATLIALARAMGKEIRVQLV